MFMFRVALFCYLPIVLLMATPASHAGPTPELHAYSANSEYEPEVLAILEDIKVGQLETALAKAEAHISKFPRSQIGHLLKADILQSLAIGISDIGDQSPLPQVNLIGFKHQLRNRWNHKAEQDQDVHNKIPASLIALGDNPYVLVADMPAGRLYVYKNTSGTPKLVRDYYLTVGSQGYGKQIEGDNKTPVGVYEINDYIEGKKLPDLYGKGAFPVNYPNLFDRYRKRTGYGIWLHGTPSDTYARSPWASEGCFVLSNDDLLDIAKYLNPEARTPVVLSDGVEWLSPEQHQQRQSEFLQVLDQWRKDWESLDIDALSAHYSKDDFNFGKSQFSDWYKKKSATAKAKTFVQLQLKVDSLFAYPGERDMFVVKFRQQYLSNNFANETQKKQYWRRDELGRWRILYEG